MEFTLQTLTPLWTGSTDPKKMDRVHETGINGSLRWWYEAVLRGLTGHGLDRERVCNPTCQQADQRCNYEQRKWVCRVCDLFGATGWKKRFRLEISGGHPLYWLQQGERAINIKPGHTGWFFPPPYVSPIIGQLITLRERNGSDPIQRQLALTNRRISSVENDLLVIVELINRWGGLAPKTQHGFGVINLQSANKMKGDIDSFLAGLRNDSVADNGLPAIGNMFFAHLYLKREINDNWWKNAFLSAGAKDERWGITTHKTVPTAPDVKYKIRFANSGRPYLSEAANCEEFFFGDKDTAPFATKAKLNISNTYKLDDGWQFRIWGWFPEQGVPAGASREQLIQELHTVVTKDQAFWDGIFGAGVIDLSKTVWREVDRCAHNRNTPDLGGNPVSPRTSAELLRCLLA